MGGKNRDASCSGALAGGIAGVCSSDSSSWVMLDSGHSDRNSPFSAAPAQHEASADQVLTATTSPRVRWPLPETPADLGPRCLPLCTASHFCCFSPSNIFRTIPCIKFPLLEIPSMVFISRLDLFKLNIHFKVFPPLPFRKRMKIDLIISLCFRWAALRPVCIFLRKINISLLK